MNFSYSKSRSKIWILRNVISTCTHVSFLNHRETKQQRLHSLLYVFAYDRHAHAYLGNITLPGKVLQTELRKRIWISTQQNLIHKTNLLRYSFITDDFNFITKIRKNVILSRLVDITYIRIIKIYFKILNCLEFHTQ